MVTAQAARALPLLILAGLGLGCGQGALGILPGVLNDPSNLSLRRAILAYGTGQFCAEALKRSLPLKLREEDPATGRFYPRSCFSQDLANKNLFIQFGGFGYAWTNLSQRLGFDSAGGVELESDFLMSGSTMYVYFRQRGTTTAQFTTRMVERPQAGTIGNLPLGPGGQALATSLGAEILKTEIARGFTVIRDANGSVQFGLGVVEKGKLPVSTAPFKIDGATVVLANDRTEVHQNQRDFVGPLEVPSGSKLTLHVAVDGAPAVSVLVFGRAAGEAWLDGYTRQVVAGPPPAPALLEQPVYSGAPFRRTLEVPPGLYYVVLDNTATAGRSQPTGFAGDDRAALVSYAATLD